MMKAYAIRLDGWLKHVPLFFFFLLLLVHESSASAGKLDKIWRRALRQVIASAHTFAFQADSPESRVHQKRSDEL